jgi:hypothetical protein
MIARRLPRHSAKRDSGPTFAPTFLVHRRSATILASSDRMPLGSGVRLGPYQVVSAIGAGGMGEVYPPRCADR